jgi:hypothetical protein
VAIKTHFQESSVFRNMSYYVASLLTYRDCVCEVYHIVTVIRMTMR